MRMRWLLPCAAVAIIGSAGLAGCGASVTSDGPVHTVTPMPSAAAIRLAVPPKAAGELARVVFSPSPATFTGTLEAKSTAGTTYQVYASCRATDPSHVIDYQARVSNVVVSTGSVTCNGTLLENTGPIATKAAQVQVEYLRAPADLEGAYAIIAP